jgi:hypothetical protein
MPFLVLAFMGAVAYVAVHHLLLWIGRRQEPLHAWVVAWCANTLIYLAALSLQGVAAEAEGAAGARLAWLTGFSHWFLLVGLSHALAGRPQPRRLMAGLLALATLYVGLALFSSLLVGDAYQRHDALGRTYWALAPGPLLPTVLPGVALVFTYSVGVLWRTPALTADERRALVAAAVVYGLAAANDLLHAARVIESVRVFDVAFVAVLLALTWLVVGRHNRLHARLHAHVVVRTAELREAAATHARLYEGEVQARRRAETALAHVKRLEGLLPVCARCRRVRDDAHYWRQLESYVTERTDAVFSHGICPDCRARFWAPPS